jgi:hypothetical protein
MRVLGSPLWACAAMLALMACSRSIEVDPKSMAATQLQLARAQIDAGNAAMARPYLTNALAFDPNSEEAKRLLATLPPAPTALPPSAIAEVAKENAVNQIALARSLAKAGQRASALQYVDAVLKAYPDLPEAKALLAELQPVTTENVPAERTVTPAFDAGVALSPPQGCSVVAGAEFVGATREQVTQAWGPPAEVKAFGPSDVRFIFGGLATSKERFTMLRYELAGAITFVLVGKNSTIEAIYWDSNRSGRFSSLPTVADGPFASLVASVDKTWLVMPYVDNDGYATVGTSAPCGAGRVIMGAYCPIGESLSVCGQGRLIYTASSSFALPPESRSTAKNLPLKSSDVQALPK